MKTFILAATLFVSLSFSKADTVVAAHDTSLSSLLTLYYTIKDALVSGDPNKAAAQADEFIKTIHAIDRKALSAADMNALMPLQEKLAFDAKHIAETKEISHQREYFQSFSNNFYKLAKAVKLSEKPVYQDYCPMKKAYWLSSETAIRNPYFGSAMLTCGKTVETLN